jgi:phosphate transport system permease protein
VTTQTVRARVLGARAERSNPIGLTGGLVGDRMYELGIASMAAMLPIVLVATFITLAVGAWPALRVAGFSFLSSSDWNPVAGQFGVAPALYGTLVSSLIALVVATPLALGVAIFLSELAPKWLRQPVAFTVDLLAAIPSVIYGLWGIFVLVPLLRGSVIPLLRDTLHLGATPFFSGVAYGPSMLAAGLVLAIMILPYTSAVAREVLMAVPRSQREAALALGATRWEMIRVAVIPYARSGIVGGVMLGLGRALGETMAVTMLIGNRPDISASLLAPGYTMASLVANEFNEATGDLHRSALLATALVLLLVRVLVNALARWLVWRTGRAGAAV